MKKCIAVIVILMLGIFMAISPVYATEINNLEEKNKSEMSQVQDEMEQKKIEYTKKYGSEEYWLAGYILEEIVRIYSIPICFVGIAAGAIFQYVLGTRRLDYKHRGFGLIITFVTILVICQVLPFVYAIVVTGWRG
jgi:hypothetical protein